MAIKDDYEQDNTFMIEEDLPLLIDQKEYDLFKDILSDEVHDINDNHMDTSQEKSESELTPL